MSTLTGSHTRTYVHSHTVQCHLSPGISLKEIKAWMNQWAREVHTEREREGIGKRNRRLMGLLLLVLIIIVLDQSLRFSVGERKGLLIGGNEHFAIFHHGGAKCMFPLTGQCEGHHWYLDTELCGCRQCRQIHLPSSGCEG